MSGPLTIGYRLPLWVIHALILAVLCVMAGLYSVRMGTDTNWDLKNYHFYAPYALLNGRIGFDLLPGQMQTYFNPFANLPAYFTIRWFNDQPHIVAFLLGAPAGLYAYALGQIAWLMTQAKLGPGWPAWIATAMVTWLGMSGAGVLPLVGTTTNDVTYAGLIMVSVWLVLRAAAASPAELSQHRTAFVVAGALAGAALGLKLTNIIYAAPLGLLVLFFLGFRPAVWMGVAMVGGFLVTFLPGAILLWREFGNPTFPLNNHIFRSVDYFSIAVLDLRFLPRSAVQAIFYPFYWIEPNTELVTELRMRDARVALGYVAALIVVGSWLGMLLRRGSFAGARPSFLLLAFCVAAYAAWVHLFGIYRYLVIVESLAGVLVFLALATLLVGWPRLILASLTLIAVGSVALTLYPGWGRTRITAQAIQVQPLPVPPGALVVMVGGAPHSYLVPFMPPDVRIVSISNNLVNSAQEHGLNRRLRRAISEHTGPVWSLTAPNDNPQVTAAELAAYGLRLAGRCELIRSNLEPGGHRLCELTR